MQRILHGFYGNEHWSLRSRRWVYTDELGWHYVCPFPNCNLAAIPYPFRAVKGYQIEQSQTVFTRVQVCAFRECSARELYFERGSGTFGEHALDQDGFWYCGFCNRIQIDQLVQCPECSNYFKGPKRFFPIDYECPNCE